MKILYNSQYEKKKKKKKKTKKEKTVKKFWSSRSATRKAGFQLIIITTIGLLILDGLI